MSNKLSKSEEKYSQEIKAYILLFREIIEQWCKHSLSANEKEIFAQELSNILFSIVAGYTDSNDKTASQFLKSTKDLNKRAKSLNDTIDKLTDEEEYLLILNGSIDLKEYKSFKNCLKKIEESSQLILEKTPSIESRGNSYNHKRRWLLEQILQVCEVSAGYKYSDIKNKRAFKTNCYKVLEIVKKYHRFMLEISSLEDFLDEYIKEGRPAFEGYHDDLKRLIDAQGGRLSHFIY